MTPGTKSGGGAEKDKHKAENDKNSAENDEIKVPKKSAETGGNHQVCFKQIEISCKDPIYSASIWSWKTIFNVCMVATCFGTFFRHFDFVVYKFIRN
jgi:hypothetical protein